MGQIEEQYTRPNSNVNAANIASMTTASDMIAGMSCMLASKCPALPDIKPAKSIK
jgi:hypothetical protein